MTGRGHEQNFCGHQQNYECWQRGHRCGVGECKCQCVDCQKDATPESEPDDQARKRLLPPRAAARKRLLPPRAGARKRRRLRARELVATMARARARARELVTTLDGERLLPPRAALCLLALAWVRTVKGLAGTMAETPATSAQTLTTMATIKIAIKIQPKRWLFGGLQASKLNFTQGNTLFQTYSQSE
ncbi:hypothetical protein B484DRAFT_402812 [Ochromonadaceae sp. CCMP2298]|nr:hypothetical protein B484DRAFT_402812 [Ochromonadaceae sp. CCMP2298]